MSMLTISCPSCSFSRQLPADKVPDGERRVTCPQCRSVFSFTKPVVSLRPAADGNSSSSPTARPVPPKLPLPTGTHDAGAGDQKPRQSVQPPPVPPVSPQRQTDTPFPLPPKQRQRPTPPRGLKDLGDLFTESWRVFQRRCGTLIVLYLLTMVAFMVPLGVTAGLVMLAGMAKGGVALVLTGGVGLLAALYFGFRCFGGFLHAVVDDQLGLRDALARGHGICLPLMWVGCLTGFVIGGGFTLFVLPGIIFMVWFFFAQFILVDEDVHGMDALLKSREYVRGEWFNVALRLLPVWVASVLIGMIPLAGPVLGVLFFPFAMIYHYLLYRDLRGMKGDVLFPCGTVDKLTWPGVALAGYVLVPLTLVSFVGFSAFGKLAGMAPADLAIVQKGGVTKGAANDGGLRVITFPQQETALPGDGSPDPAGTGTSPESTEVGSGSGHEAYPERIHVFIYAVNYTGTVRANGTPVRELEGKTDMQYSYNQDGKGLRYGENQIEVDYAELPEHPGSFLEIHLKVSRYGGSTGNELLGEWRIKEKGSGTKTFTFDISKQ